MKETETLTTPELPEIDDCPPFDDKDEACFAELREVLARHGMTHRFGMTLLHRHFTVQSDEILLESCDVAGRRLLVSPVPRASLKATHSRPTNWRLDSLTATQECTQVCSYESGDSGVHSGDSDHL